MTPENLSLLLKVLDNSVAPLCTLLAGFIGVRYGLEQIRIQKRIEFIERQLSEFYSPLLSYREEIRSKSALRARISSLAGEAWQEVCDRNPKPFINHDNECQPYKKIIEYDNQQLRTCLLPLYKRMLAVFNEKYWLAEPETRKYYSDFCDFIELWDRAESDSLPADVIRKVNHSEDKLIPFYNDLAEKVVVLRKKLCQ